MGAAAVAMTHPCLTMRDFAAEQAPTGVTRRNLGILLNCAPQGDGILPTSE